MPLTDLDHCPTCGQRIRDTDPAGREDGNGQRHCAEHPPASCGGHGTILNTTVPEVEAIVAGVLARSFRDAPNPTAREKAIAHYVAKELLTRGYLS